MPLFRKPGKVCVYYLTYRCQAMCPFCDVWQKGAYQEMQEVEPAQVMQNLERAWREGARSVYVTGGEPLLVQALPEILQKAKQLGFATSLSTNGILYEAQAQVLGKNVDLMYVSLDGPHASAHDENRGEGVFQKAHAALVAARKRGQQAKILFVLSRENVLMLPEMVDLAESLETPLELSFLYDHYGLQGFARDTFPYLRRYLVHPWVELNLAALLFVKKGGNQVAVPRCRATESVISFGPDGHTFSPCRFYDRNFSREQALQQQGRGLICQGCMRWDYFLPSFYQGRDVYRGLAWFSDYIQRMKKSRGLFPQLFLNCLKLFL